MIRMVKKIYRKMRALLNRIAERFKIFRWNLRANALYRRTLAFKKCYYGPYTGEFGHLLGHNLPFIAHLHSKGIKVYFCGMEIHKPFFVDENGKEIVSSYLSLRDFFVQSLPSCNKADEPQDINTKTRNFVQSARSSFLPYWNNADHDYYFYFFRWWILKHNYIKAFDLSKVYKTANTNSVVIFPRKINDKSDPNVQLKNNGEAWDYLEIAKTAAKHFDKVFVVGHPAFTKVEFESFENVEVCITRNNSLILEMCCNSKLIVTPHSGSVYLGEYTDTPVLIIYKGGKEIGDIQMTRNFKNALGRKHEFNYAFSYQDIEDHFYKFSNEKVRN